MSVEPVKEIFRTRRSPKIVSATTPKQRVLICTLDKLAAEARAQKLEPPAIVVIGEIVPLRDELIGAQTNQAAALK